MVTRICVDIGNSRITCGVFSDRKLLDLSHHLASDSATAANDIIDKAKATQATGIALCSVVPAVSRAMHERFAQHKMTVLDTGAAHQRLISDTYDTLGADRVANAVAALKLYVRSHCAIIVDLGTATTLTAVDPQGKFLGGMITLGLGKTFAALAESTAQLPDLQFALNGRPLEPLATETAPAIAAGCTIGHVGLIQHWVHMAAQALGRKCTIVATGGYSNMIVPYTKIFDHVDPNLTIQGVNFIAESLAEPKDQV